MGCKKLEIHLLSYLLAWTCYYTTYRLKSVLSQYKAPFKIAITVYSFLQEILEYETEHRVKGFSLRCVKRKPLTSSTLPNPPTPSVAIISRFWNGDDEENLATFSFSWIISRESALDRFRWDMDLLLKRSDLLHSASGQQGSCHGALSLPQQSHVWVIPAYRCHKGHSNFYRSRFSLKVGGGGGTGGREREQ